MADLRAREFYATGSAETFRVPRHVPGTLKVWARGGRGRRVRWTANLEGGPGGTITGTLDLAPGTALSVIVGYGAESGDGVGDGEPGVGRTGLGPFLGGEGGDGGSGGSANFRPGAGGGAASELRVGSTRILVAGGGGGGGDGTVGLGTNARGGAGGHGVADGSTTDTPAIFGKGGTLTAAGAGGTSVVWNTPPGAVNGSAGSSGTGGDGGYAGFSSTQWIAGGGGGGGYYGGGGGGGRTIGSAPVDQGGGGGGSSWADTSILTDIDNFSTGNPIDDWAGSFILFEWEPRIAGVKLGLGFGPL